MPNAPTGVDADLGRHMQSEIAAAAVTMLAETHEGAARGMLADKRIAALLGESATPLGEYIGAQAKARAIDLSAEAEAFQANEMVAADMTATDYVASLIDPASGAMQFPPRFNQDILADPRLSPPVKAGVLTVYDRLRMSGDLEKSDPLVITDAIRRAANGEPPDAGELLQQAGVTLTAHVAVALTRKLSLSPVAQVEAQQMMDAMDMVASRIATPEYGIAGARAYGRFVNWFVGEYARQGPGSLNPRMDNYMFNPDIPGNPVERFTPTGSDLIGERVAAQRPSLQDIFGGRKLDV